MAKHAGFCFGVKKALEKAESALDHPEVYTLGPLIHNAQVVNRLASQGIKKIEDLDEIQQGKVIIRSHGVAPEVLTKATEKGLKILDATCPFVQKAQQLAKEYTDKGYQVVIVGDASHPEVVGILGWTENKAIVIDNIIEAEKLKQFPKLCVVAQTTQSLEKFKKISDVLKKKTLEFKVCNTICHATKERQDAAKHLAEQTDLMIVVGGRNSSNTRKLFDICTATGTKTYYVESAHELKDHWFVNVNRVGLTAGASTPDWILEEVIKKMTELNQSAEKETQEEIIEKTAQQLKTFNRGDIIQGTVAQVGENEVLIDVGGKSEGIIPVTELSLKENVVPSEEVQVGDVIQVYVIKSENEEGNPILSKRRADRVRAWEKIQESFETGDILEGKAEQVVKGGLLIDIGLRGFMPASLVDIGYVENLEDYVGKDLRFKIVEIDREKNKIILAQKPVLEAEVNEQKKKTLAGIKAGEKVKGTVRRLTNFGAFVDIGGIDGLLHVSELSWGRVNHPSEVLSEGDEIEVYILAVDQDKEKISLGLKQLLDNPWKKAAKNYQEGQIVTGKVVRTVSFGAFVELEPGVEGLVHISQLAREHVARAEDVVQVGQEVTVKILDVDVKSERISLSIKDASDEEKDSDVQEYMEKADEGTGVTLGDLFGDILKNVKK